jgi:FixJ family two-component response regulator
MNERGWVAIIDDDASVRRSLSRVLNAYDVRVETFGSAEEFLERTTADPPHCVVVDVQLADGMTGLELLGRLASASDASGPAVIMMTGLAISEGLMGSLGARASWLRKPFEAARLIALLPSHLQQPQSPTMAATPLEHAPGRLPRTDIR